jgi:transposase
LPHAIERLDEIPGIGPIAAAVILTEIGLDMTRFPTAGHLVSWARFAPGIKESAGKKKGKAHTGHGNRYLARILGEAAVGAARTNTFLGERYRVAQNAAAKRKPWSPSAAASSSSSGTCCPNPIPATRTSAPTTTTPASPPTARNGNHVRQLEALGYTVTLTPAA